MGSLWEKWQTHNYDVCFVRLPPSFPAVPQSIKDYLLYSRMIYRIGQLLSTGAPVRSYVFYFHKTHEGN
jgi:hypothetical protein